MAEISEPSAAKDEMGFLKSPTIDIRGPAEKVWVKVMAPDQETLRQMVSMTCGIKKGLPYIVGPSLRKVFRKGNKVIGLAVIEEFNVECEEWRI